MTYRYQIGAIRAFVVEYESGEAGHATSTESTLLSMVAELNRRLARGDHPGDNSLSLDRLADHVEACVLAIRTRRRAAEEEEARQAKEQRKRDGRD